MGFGVGLDVGLAVGFGVGAGVTMQSKTLLKFPVHPQAHVHSAP